MWQHKQVGKVCASALAGSLAITSCFSTSHDLRLPATPEEVTGVNSTAKSHHNQVYLRQNTTAHEADRLRVDLDSAYWLETGLRNSASLTQIDRIVVKDRVSAGIERMFNNFDYVWLAGLPVVLILALLHPTQDLLPGVVVVVAFVGSVVWGLYGLISGIVTGDYMTYHVMPDTTAIR